MRDGALGVVGPHALECARDLGGQPPLRQKVAHYAKEHAVDRQLGAAPCLEALPAGPHTRCTGSVGATDPRNKGWAILPGGSLPAPARSKGHRSPAFDCPNLTAEILVTIRT